MKIKLKVKNTFEDSSGKAKVYTLPVGSKYSLGGWKNWTYPSNMEHPDVTLKTKKEYSVKATTEQIAKRKLLLQIKPEAIAYLGRPTIAPYFSLISKPIVKDSVKDSKTYKIKNHDSGRTHTVRATSFKDAKEKYDRFIVRDSDIKQTITNAFSVLSNRKEEYNNVILGMEKNQFNGYDIYPSDGLTASEADTLFAKLKSIRSLKVVKVANYIRVVPAGTGDSYENEADSSSSFALDASIPATDIGEFKNKIRAILKEMSKDDKWKSFYFANSIIENYVWNTLKRQGVLTKLPSNLYKIIREVMSEREINRLFAKDSFTADAGIAQNDIKSTYLPEDANADNIKYIGFNELRKLSFYEYGGRYFAHHDLEGRTEEIDKAVVQKVLKKNLLGEVKEEELMSNASKTNETVGDAFEDSLMKGNKQLSILNKTTRNGKDIILAKWGNEFVVGIGWDESTKNWSQGNYYRDLNSAFKKFESYTLDSKGGDL